MNKGDLLFCPIPSLLIETDKQRNDKLFSQRITQVNVLLSQHEIIKVIKC